MADAGAQRRRAILCVLGSSGTFAVAAALVKGVSPEVPIMEVVLFRNLFALLLVLPLVARSGGWPVLRTRRPWGHLARGAAGLLGMIGSFYGYAHLPLAAVTALGFAMPIFLAVLSAPLLHERVTGPRALAIGAGLVGVLLVIRPWQGTAGLPLFDTGVVLFAVMAWAGAMISIRRMGRAGERNLTIVALFALFCTVVSAVAAIPVWVTPRPAVLLVLVAVGLLSGVAQLLMTEGYRSGEASMLAPFEYSAILYTTALGWAAWGEVPGGWEAAGIGLLIATGLFTWWCETRVPA